MELTNIRKIINASKSVCVFTGAGISAESGIPTFRDNGGLWENYRLEDLVTPEAFSNDPSSVWRWHMWLRSLIIDSEPNAAHIGLAELERCKSNFLLITQNIDDLHERAGSKNIAKIHGDIMRMVCISNKHISEIDKNIDYKELTNLKSIPVCPVCGGKSRPDVVWFGEMLPKQPLEAAYDFLPSCDLFIIIGTSGVVSGGYGFTEMAKRVGAYIIEINPEISNLSRLADFSFREPATVGITKLLGV